MLTQKQGFWIRVSRHMQWLTWEILDRKCNVSGFLIYRIRYQFSRVDMRRLSLPPEQPNDFLVVIRQSHFINIIYFLMWEGYLTLRAKCLDLQVLFSTVHLPWSCLKSDASPLHPLHSWNQRKQKYYDFNREVYFTLISRHISQDEYIWFC
jgi:hypothetical protein